MPEEAKCKVVIVEDEGLIAADLKRRLEDAGYLVPSTADTGNGALQAIAQTSPDLVLMDIRLKGEMDGIEVAERVRREFDVPVVYLTAYEDRQTLERASHSEAFAYIKKPVAAGSLRGSLELAIAKHRQERYLRQQRDWFSASFAAVPDAVVVTDGWGRISYMNGRAEELTGCSAGQALGQPYNTILPFLYEQKGWPIEDLPPVEDLVPAAQLEGGPIPLPRHICLAGPERTRAVEGTVSPRWHEGRLEGAVILFRDIGARQFAEERNLEESKHAALVRWASAVASRLDLEVGVVADETAGLLQNLPPDNPLRRHAETLEMAALDALGVVSRLESFAQPQGAQVRQVQINQVLSSLEPAWKQRAPELSLVLGAVPMAVEADAFQLTRALSLLLQHAIDARKPGAGLLVETSRAELLDLGAWVRVRFAYTSFGEDARMLERAFEPSWTGPREGLPAAYALLREMGGFLTSGLERGGSVSWEVYLRPSVTRAAAASARPSVLLVERNACVGRLLERHFDENGFDLVCAGSCRDARTAAELYQFSLVIANVAEGDPDRPELDAELERLQPGVPVRWLSGYCAPDAPDGGAPPAWRLLTKWDLSEWVRHAVAAAPQRSSLPPATPARASASP